MSIHACIYIIYIQNERNIALVKRPVNRGLVGRVQWSGTQLNGPIQIYVHLQLPRLFSRHWSEHTLSASI